MTEPKYKRNERHAKKAGREAQVGDVLWVMRDISTKVAPYENPYLVQDYTVTHMHPLLGGAMISGALSVEALVLREGPVYTERPKGRGMYDATPQYPGVLRKYIKAAEQDEFWDLNGRELRELEEAVTQALTDRRGYATAKRDVAKAKGEPKRLLKLVA